MNNQQYDTIHSNTNRVLPPEFSFGGETKVFSNKKKSSITLKHPYLGSEGVFPEKIFD